ncbi:DUF4312 family protein [Serratia plymuthica]|jgi:uncharacterized protein (TIGR03578 family)|uniref:Cytoplasmic protein n=2 Tax=Serratia plymuthica TaxID=82996 RepID=A0A2X4V128_SERPL|nr:MULTISPECIES: DUF4312 family protein [Serratia]AEF47578.1 Conserved hypothetical protein CHP03578 [Serratia plymuthica AS9]AEF52530.1 Conserved hypothetical protein CHP03578 [Serratia sp. AS12]AEG30237.1 Conserved hypothetical protein CHP03578 [Serratia sp. AS13]AGO57136.1 hypothetical protein SOD_c41870 [Serratia plymuthica 4Rx13]AGP46178.1 cytoplasmic protein [Serratia plymuthica S13]
MKEHYTTSVKVEGKGDSKAKAFASALANVQGTVLKSTSNILLRIEPQDVSVLKAEEKITKEKFLFFFLPRERKTYTVTLEITVNVTMINTEKVVFVTK